MVLGVTSTRRTSEPGDKRALSPDVDVSNVPGGEATIYWGSRSYNYHSSYAISAGLFAQGRYGFGGEGRQADAVFGVQIDLEYFVLPFALAYQAIKR